MTSTTLRAAVVGAVDSSAVVAHSLAGSSIQLVGIAGYEPSTPESAGDSYDLRGLARQLGTDFLAYQRVNDETVIEQLQQWNVDYLFIVGLSQLVSTELRQTARYGCIGYHPTALPAGRGRAPVAWLILNETSGASTLFEIGDGADEGGILEQVPFIVRPSMDAQDVVDECHRTLSEAMERLIPRLQDGDWAPIPQDEGLATYLGKRDPKDGLIDWRQPAEAVDKLIRAAAPPHPGAYVYQGGRRLRIFYSAGAARDTNHSGVVGKILRKGGDYYEVQCSPGVVRISTPLDDYDDPVELRVGTLLRTRVEDEIHELRQHVAELHQAVEDLRNTIAESK